MEAAIQSSEILTGVSEFLEHWTRELCSISISIMELLSIGIILVTTLIAFIRLFSKTGTSYARVYLLHGQSVGLTFKLGAEILKTVNVASMDEIWQIVMLVVIKAMMILLIDWELNGTHASEKKAQSYAAGEEPESGLDRYIRYKMHTGIHGLAHRETIDKQQEEIDRLNEEIDALKDDLEQIPQDFDRINESAQEKVQAKLEDQPVNK